MDTVTISLETYESMKKQIETLSEEVKQKEVVRYLPHDYTQIFGYIALILIIFSVFFTFFLML